MYRRVSKSKITQRVGSRAQVMHGNAKMTGGGLKKKDLKYNKQGKIVSKKMSSMAKKEKRLQKAGWVTKKGQFGAVRSMRGGSYYRVRVSRESPAGVMVDATSTPGQFYPPFATLGELFEANPYDKLLADFNLKFKITLNNKHIICGQTIYRTSIYVVGINDYEISYNLDGVSLNTKKENQVTRIELINNADEC